MPDQERRKRSLTDADIEAFRKALRDTDHQASCRFMAIDPEEMKEMLTFYRKFNEALNDSKQTIRKTVLVLTISALTGMTVIGFWAKVKQIMSGE